MAIGFSVLFRTTDVLNFAHGQLIMVLPVAILIAVQWGASVFVAYAIGIVVLLLVALLIEAVAVRPFMHSGQALPWILSTLGASVILTELLAIPFGGETRLFPFGFPSNNIDVLGYRISIAEIAAVVVAFIVAGLLAAFYRWT
ncbi:MAG: hypothetical protein KF680_03795, partial [Cryobacterium sp.]|nr:hypothetical protein [Cryobacterium sp.]